MRRKTEKERTIAEAKKIARTFLRLKYSILADRELNDALPEIERRIEQAWTRGDAFLLDPTEFFELPSGVE